MQNTNTIRSNVKADIPEVYYRRTLAIPFLDHLFNELGEGFTSHANIAALGLCLVPKVLMEKNDKNVHVQSFAIMYESDLPAPLSLDAELHAWKMKFCKWKPEDLPTIPLAALNQCDNRAYPNTFTLLQLLCTIPVTSCEAERSFSALRRIKTFLRTTMGKERLNSLALLHIHREIPINLDEAVTKFAQKHNRKVQLI